jgi:hypothetical protein
VLEDTHNRCALVHVSIDWRGIFFFAVQEPGLQHFFFSISSRAVGRLGRAVRTEHVRRVRAGQSLAYVMLFHRITAKWLFSFRTRIRYAISFPSAALHVVLVDMGAVFKTCLQMSLCPSLVTLFSSLTAKLGLALSQTAFYIPSCTRREQTREITRSGQPYKNEEHASYQERLRPLLQCFSTSWT